jgi:hypothetical protein
MKRVIIGLVIALATAQSASADRYIKVDAQGNALSGAIMCDAATCGAGSIYSQLTLNPGERYVLEIEEPVIVPQPSAPSIPTVETPTATIPVPAPINTTPTLTDTKTVIVETPTVVIETTTAVVGFDWSVFWIQFEIWFKTFFANFWGVKP